MTGILKGTISVVGASALAQAAASLSVGQSMRFGSIAADTIYVAGESGAEYLQWGSSAFYDPVGDKVHFIGKRHSSYPYHWLTYDESADAWAVDADVVPTSSQTGHAYDQNTGDPATGDYYFFMEPNFYKWDGSWATLSQPGAGARYGASITWFPGVGLVYVGRASSFAGIVQIFNGSSWSTVSGTSNSGLHQASEYNAIADAMIFGGGNDGSTMWRMDNDQSISSIATPPFNLGSATGQGVMASVPNADQIIGYDKAGSFTEYDFSADAWTSVNRSAGDGSSAQSGAPNITGSSVIAATLHGLNCLMFIEVVSSVAGADVWLYRHV